MNKAICTLKIRYKSSRGVGQNTEINTNSGVESTENGKEEGGD